MANALEILGKFASNTVKLRDGRTWGIYSQRNPDNIWTPSLEVLGGDAAGLIIEAHGKTWTLTY